jgi:hypothetical protein
MQDRTVRTLLALTAVALWGLLLRPFFAAAPARAQSPLTASSNTPAITTDEKGIAVVSDGYMTYFRRNTDGSPQSGGSVRHRIVP